MFNLLKKIIGVFAFLFACFFALGVIYPTVSMSANEVLMGKAMLAVLAIIFGSLAYWLLRKKS